MRFRRPRKRTLVMLLLFAAGGAIINVAVAWGCVLSLPPEFDEPQIELADTQREIPQEEVVEILRKHFHDSRIRMGHGEEQQRIGGYGEAERRFGWKTVYASWGGDNINFMKSTRLAGWPTYGLNGWFEWDDRKTAEDKGHYYGALMVPEWAKREVSAWRLIDYLPWHPVWPGFAINTIFYAAILWVLRFAPGFVRRRIRARRGQCPACAYPIGTSDVCTECGRPVRA